MTRACSISPTESIVVAPGQINIEEFNRLLNEVYAQGGSPEPPVGNGGRYALHRTREGFREAIGTCMRSLALLPEGSYDTIYVTGQSGIVPGSVCAFLLNKSLAILRKARELSHGHLIERDHAVMEPRCVIIDDFLCHGKTMARLLKHLPGTLVGVVLYVHPLSDYEGCRGYVQPDYLARRKVQLRRVNDTQLFNLEDSK